MGSWQTFYVAEQDDSIVSFPDSSVCWCVLNNSTHPFSHKKLRQALAFVLQRCDFLTNSPLSLNPAYTPLLPQHSLQVFDRFPQQDVQLARRLWHEGWAELGVQKSQIPSMTLIFHHKGIREHVAEQLQQQLKKYLDFDCHLKPLAWNVLFEKMTKGDFEIGLMQWVSWVNDPIYTLNAFRLSDEDINFSKWSNPVFQELLDCSDLEIDRKKRCSLLAQAEKILCEEVPVIPLFYQPYQALVKKNLQITYSCLRATFNLARSFKKKDVPDVNRTY